MHRARAVGWRGSTTLILVAVVLAHELTYLLAHGLTGYEAAMADAAHERYWTTLVLTVIAIACAIAVVVARQLIRLHRLAAQLDDVGIQSSASFSGLVARLWRRVAFGALAIYLIQENVESITAGQPIPGLRVLAGDHAIALPVIALVALTLAVVGALVVWKREALLDRIRSATVPTRRQAPRFARDAGISASNTAHLSAANGVRAPPLGATQPS